MDIKSQVLPYLKKEFLQIEHRTDITDDEKVTKIIKLFSAACASVAIQPIPFADMYILTPIQAYMGTRISAIRGLPITDSEAIELLKEVGATIGLGYLAQQLAIGAYKTGFPVLAGFTTIPLVFSLTYGIGRVMDGYLKSKARKQTLDPDEIKKIWQKGRTEGEKSSNIKAAKNAKESIANRSK